MNSDKKACIYSVKKYIFKNFAKFAVKHLCQSLFFSFSIKQTLAQVFSCEFCEIFKNTFFYRTPPVAASDLCWVKIIPQLTEGWEMWQTIYKFQANMQMRIIFISFSFTAIFISFVTTLSCELQFWKYQHENDLFLT